VSCIRVYFGGVSVTFRCRVYVYIVALFL
jgi:hypothetical protein